MDPRLLLEWWNLVFVIPFGFGLLFLGMQLVGLDYQLGPDADAELDHDVDAPALDAHAEHDADHDAEHDADAHHEVAVHAGGHQPPGLVLSALSVLGLGKVPVSVMGMSLCFSWAGAGVALTALLRPWLQAPALFFPLAAAGAAVASVGVTSCLARLMAAYMPKSSSFHQRTEDLEGSVGEALYTIPLDAEGVIRVRDRHGSEVQFSAFIKAQAPVPAGACVLLLRYDAARHAFLVEQAPPELKALKSKTE